MPVEPRRRPLQPPEYVTCVTRRVQRGSRRESDARNFFDTKVPENKIATIHRNLGYYLSPIKDMWLLVGMTVLMSRAVMGNLTDDNAYYLADTNDDRALSEIEKPRYAKFELETSEATSSVENEEDQQTDDGTPDNSIGNRDTKRSVADVDSHGKSSGQRQAPAPLATLLYWPEGQHETVGMELRRTPLMQERRNPAFSPWGGKRDVQQRYKTITKIRRPVRVPFNSWGGKRDGQRTAKFFNWGGKRAPTVFNSWGGKRASPAFNSWGGKRASPTFNSWGGKRAESSINDDYNPTTNYGYYQRHRKSSTLDVGQRMDNDQDTAEDNYHDELIDNNETGEKRGSLKLIASGEMTTSGSTQGDTFSRVPFEPWGGKKRVHLGCSSDETRSASVSFILCKIGQLIPSMG